MKLDLNKEMNSWLIVLNNNVKWSIALTIRFLTVFTLFIIFCALLKWTGIISEFKSILMSETSSVHQTEMVVESKPTTPTHKSDIQKTTELQELIADKIKKKSNYII